MSKSTYPTPDGFMGRSAIDDPQYRWLITLVNVAYSRTGRAGFVLNGHVEPPKNIVRGNHIWTLDFIETNGDGQEAFYVIGERALMWDEYVSRKKRPGLIERTYSKAYIGPIGTPEKQPGGDAPGFAHSVEVRLKTKKNNTNPPWSESDRAVAQAHALLAKDAENSLKAKTRDIGVSEIVKVGRREGMALVHGRMKQLLEVIIMPEPAYKALSTALYRIQKLIEGETD